MDRRIVGPRGLGKVLECSDTHTSVKVLWEDRPVSTEKDGVAWEADRPGGSETSFPFRYDS